MEARVSIACFKCGNEETILHMTDAGYSEVTGDPIYTIDARACLNCGKVEKLSRWELKRARI